MISYRIETNFVRFATVSKDADPTKQRLIVGLRPQHKCQMTYDFEFVGRMGKVRYSLKHVY